jgi:ATP-dependent Clp protease adaptor protein ClpS
MKTVFNSGNTQWQTQDEGDVDVLNDEVHDLIVWNDDVNTFDWVIESLIDVCGQK